MIYGYIRVSTDKQNTENQYFEIEQFCQKEGLIISKMVEETISSRTDLSKRKLGSLLKKLKKGDILIATEISRLGRNLLQIMSILHTCMSRGCLVFTIKDNYRLGSDIQSKVLAFAFGLSAEIERNLISQRTTEALRRMQSEGKKLGRPKGSTKLSKKHYTVRRQISELLATQTPKARIARMFEIDCSTLYRYIKQRTPAA